MKLSLNTKVVDDKTGLEGRTIGPFTRKGSSGGLSIGRMAQRPRNVKRICSVDKKHKKKVKRAAKRKKIKLSKAATRTTRSADEYV